MGVVERRERERGETVQRILDAAREIGAREGYASITMRGIADRAEYTAAALYRHYRDKDAILRALAAAERSALAREMRAQSQIGEPLERLRRGARAYADFGLADADRYRLIFSVGEDEAGEEIYGFFRDAVAQGMSALRFRPELTDVDLIAQTVWGGVHGIVMLHAAPPIAARIPWRPPRLPAGLMVDTLVRGLARGRA